MIQPPEWLENAQGSVWLFIGLLADAYSCHKEAVFALEQAARLGVPDRAHYLVLAATHVSLEEREMALALLESAEEMETGKPLVRVVRAMVNQETSESISDLNFEQVSDDDKGLVQTYLANIFLRENKIDEGLASAERAIKLLPERAGPRILAAEAYLTRAHEGSSHARESDLLRATTLALEACDLRRLWDGPSTDGARLAAGAAVLLGDFQTALRIALPPPEGEALDREALDKSLLEVAVTCATVLRKTELLDLLASRDEGGAETFLSRAALLQEAEACTTEVKALYRAAAEAATSASHIFGAFFGLAECGEWPIAGFDAFAQDHPEQAEVVLAVSESKRGLISDAVVRLRTRSRTFRPAATVLARLYEETNETGKPSRPGNSSTPSSATSPA